MQCIGDQEVSVTGGCRASVYAPCHECRIVRGVNALDKLFSSVPQSETSLPISFINRAPRADQAASEAEFLSKLQLSVLTGG